MSVGPPGGGPDRRAVSPLPLRGACSGADPGRPCPCRTDRRRCQLEGCGAVRVGPSTLRRQLGQHEVPDRQRRAAATPRGYRAERGHSPSTATTRTTQSHTVAIGGSSPVQVGGRCASRAGPGPSLYGPARVGPRMPLACGAIIIPDSPGHWPAYLGTPCPQRHSQVTRTPPGPLAPGGPVGLLRRGQGGSGH